MRNLACSNRIAYEVFIVTVSILGKQKSLCVVLF